MKCHMRWTKLIIWLTKFSEKIIHWEKKVKIMEYISLRNEKKNWRNKGQEIMMIFFVGVVRNCLMFAIAFLLKWILLSWKKKEKKIEENEKQIYDSNQTLVAELAWMQGWELPNMSSIPNLANRGTYLKYSCVYIRRLVNWFEEPIVSRLVSVLVTERLVWHYGLISQYSGNGWAGWATRYLSGTSAEICICILTWVLVLNRLTAHTHSFRSLNLVF